MSRGPHRRIFLAHYKPPWRCYFCKQPIVGSVTVHHRNGDHEDNRVRNLVPSHHGCHTRHHHLGRTQDATWRLRRREAMIGHVVSDETRQKISRANTGKKRSAEARALMSRRALERTR